MTKQAISVTLSPSSLQYLRAKTLTEKRKSISETLDLLILANMGTGETKRTVVGTIEADVARLDSGEMDAAVRSWFERGIGRKSRKKRKA